MRTSLHILTVGCALLSSAAATAQTPVPGLENFTLELPRPSPTPTASPTPPPAATPSATPTTAAPSPVIEPAPLPSSTALSVTPRPTGRSSAAPQPRATPTVPVAPAIPPPPSSAGPGNVSPTPTAAPATTPQPEEGGLGWEFWGAVALLLALGGLLWWRMSGRPAPFTTPQPRSARPPDDAASSSPTEPEPSPDAPAAAVAAPGGLVTSSLKPAVGIELVPLRGGIDTLRARLEYRLRVSNTGRSAAGGVVAEAWLLSGGHELSSELARLFAAPAGEPMLPPFQLPAGASIDLDGLGHISRDGLTIITAGERRSFVPVLAVRIRYRDGRDTPHEATAAFLVGLARTGQDRLAPLPLDRGNRMYDQLAALRYEA